MQELVMPLALGVAALFVMLIRAERRLARIEAQQEALLRHFNLLAPLDTQPTDEVRALACDPKRRIDAIRLYRQQSGAELKAAVEMIDQLTGRA